MFLYRKKILLHPQTYLVEKKKSEWTTDASMDVIYNVQQKYELSIFFWHLALIFWHLALKVNKDVVWNFLRQFYTV